jgi:hypothetical protein
MARRSPAAAATRAHVSKLPPRAVARALRRLLAEGAAFRCAGEARGRPERLFAAGYAPRHAVELFGTTFYLSGPRQNADLRFFVAWVVQPAGRGGRLAVHPRIFYKDVSLIWRSASHFVRSARENWIGKGDLRSAVLHGVEIEYSAESTTDLPLELQDALEAFVRDASRVPHDELAIALVLRRGPDDRIQAYRDFTAPRRRAQRDPRRLPNRGRPIARFLREGDPASLRFAKGFEPDFARGVVGESRSRSSLYGGTLRRVRILSRNRDVQYLFFAGPRQVWLAPPQATTTELSSYGVRTVDVVVPEDLCVPGYEYHYLDESEDPPVLVSQIPPGFVGAPSERDPSRSDASPWLDRLPVIRAFRREVLGRRARPRRSASR